MKYEAQKWKVVFTNLIDSKGFVWHMIVVRGAQDVAAFPVALDPGTACDETLQAEKRGGERHLVVRFPFKLLPSRLGLHNAQGSRWFEPARVPRKSIPRTTHIIPQSTFSSTLPVITIGPSAQ